MPKDHAPEPPGRAARREDERGIRVIFCKRASLSDPSHIMLYGDEADSCLAIVHLAPPSIERGIEDERHAALVPNRENRREHRDIVARTHGDELSGARLKSSKRARLDLTRSCELGVGESSLVGGLNSRRRRASSEPLSDHPLFPAHCHIVG